ncbi:MAG: hypothetical protein JWO13_2859 [Acidobacteriales bacterium]|nr:hypothetical protein [Terriglobales bacterium]
MFKTCSIAITLLILGCASLAQDAPTIPPTQSETKPAAQNPPIKVNILNVCTPDDAEKHELAAALKKIPAKAAFATPWEVTRGVTQSEADVTKYIRLRRELTGDPVFNIIQYSLSSDPKETQETLIFKVKDPKDLLLVSIEDSISAGAAAPSTLLDADTPATHIKIERFGKSAIALARCDKADQSAYEELFADASKAISAYRKSLGLRSTFSNELKWLGTSNEKAATSAANKRRDSPKSTKATQAATPKK